MNVCRTPRPTRPLRGGALPLALVLLLILTMVGAATVHTAITQEKLAGAVADRQRTFQAAEWALRWGEQQVWLTPPNIVVDNTTGCNSMNDVTDGGRPEGFALRICTARLVETGRWIPCGPPSSNQRRCASYLIIAEAQPTNGEAQVRPQVRLESILLLEEN